MNICRTHGGTYYYHTDHLGSSNVITDGAGNKVREIYYMPYGAMSGASGSADVRHKFTGQELDDETGLYYYGARYYDPAIGRFISADTIVPNFADPQSLNRYSYERNNPLLYVDPSGHFFLIDDIIVAAATYIATNAAVIAEGAAIGAAMGGVSAAATGGDILQGMALGAVSGAVFAGVGGFVGSSTTTMLENSAQYCSQSFYSAGKIVGAMAGGAASGATAAAITGGDVGQGALIGMGTAGSIAALSEAALYMRRVMWKQSQINPANSRGQSVGVLGDGRKVAGCRWPCIGSLLGGIQGEQGYFFGIPYQPGGVVDVVLEYFAGPHDFFNDPIWYDQMGNLKPLSGLAKGIGEITNWMNIPIATPFALSSMVQPYTGALMPAMSEFGTRE